MKRMLNTLYVTTQGAYLARDGETVSVRVDHETKLRVPIHTLSGIVCFGQVSCSPFLMGLCAERSVGLSFLTEHGRFLARVNGAVRGNVLLRREQYRRADDQEASAAIARAVISAKIANCRTVLLRAAREHSDADAAKALNDASGRMARVLTDLDGAQMVDSLRGKEGDAARVYFGVFDHLIIAQKDAFAFHERSRRPPLDPINALLSFLYTLVLHDIESALETVGLDPGVGFLHRDRPGRPGLALDILEEFRPYLADRLALTLVNRQQVKDKGFNVTESGAVLMDDDTRKGVLTAFQKRKQEEIQHPYLGEKVPIGLLPYVQALLMSRYLRGDIDGYPPFIAR
jgi:CRISPR-associated protein Cas1